jgi:hypothetical protein
VNKFRYHLQVQVVDDKLVPFVVRSKGEARMVGKKIRKRITPLNRSSACNRHSFLLLLFMNDFMKNIA